MSETSSVWDHPVPPSLWDNPVFRKWTTETMQMLHDAQQAEYIVAAIDERPARSAQLDIVNATEARVILVDRPDWMPEW